MQHKLLVAAAAAIVLGGITGCSDNKSTTSSSTTTSSLARSSSPTKSTNAGAAPYKIIINGEDITQGLQRRWWRCVVQPVGQPH